VPLLDHRPALGRFFPRFCAGVRLTDTNSSRNWRCFCDVRVTLLGDRRELSRTVRWVLTPDASAARR